MNVKFDEIALLSATKIAESGFGRPCAATAQGKGLARRGGPSLLIYRGIQHQLRTTALAALAGAPAGRVPSANLLERRMPAQQRKPGLRLSNALSRRVAPLERKTLASAKIKQGLRDPVAWSLTDYNLSFFFVPLP